MSQNGQTHFKNLTASVSDHFGTLCIIGLSTNTIKWSHTLKQFVGKKPTNCLSVFDHFVGLALKGLKKQKLLSDTSKFIRIEFNKKHKVTKKLSTFWIWIHL